MLNFPLCIRSSNILISVKCICTRFQFGFCMIFPSSIIQPFWHSNLCTFSSLRHNARSAFTFTQLIRCFSVRFCNQLMDSWFTIHVAWRKNLVVRDDLIIKIYRRLAKKRYLRGKHTYEYERIYVPIPSRLHDIVSRL